MRNVKERTKGVTLDQAKLKYVALGLDIIKGPGCLGS